MVGQSSIMVEVGDIWEYKVSSDDESEYFLFIERLPFPINYSEVYPQEQLWQVIDLMKSTPDEIYWFPNYTERDGYFKKVV